MMQNTQLGKNNYIPSLHKSPKWPWKFSKYVIFPLMIHPSNFLRLTCTGTYVSHVKTYNTHGSNQAYSSFACRQPMNSSNFCIMQVLSCGTHALRQSPTDYFQFQSFIVFRSKKCLQLKEQRHKSLLIHIKKKEAITHA